MATITISIVESPLHLLAGIPSNVKNNIRRSNTEEFVQRAKEVHGDKYNYDKVNYVNAKDKVIIICAKHGDFDQAPDSHLRGQGCPKCGGCLISV
jgi:hypothetical protein